MNRSANRPICPVCQKPYGRVFRGHADCGRIALLRGLDQAGAVSLNRAHYLSLPGWTPVEDAPGLTTFNGIGAKLYGQRDEHAATRTATVTLYFVLLFVPVFPISVYRVVTLPDGHFFFLAEGSAERGDWMRALRVWIVLLAIYGAWHLIVD